MAFLFAKKVGKLNAPIKHCTGLNPTVCGWGHKNVDVQCIFPQKLSKVCWMTHFTFYCWQTNGHVWVHVTPSKSTRCSFTYTTTIVTILQSWMEISKIVLWAEPVCKSETHWKKQKTLDILIFYKPAVNSHAHHESMNISNKNQCFGCHMFIS